MENIKQGDIFTLGPHLIVCGDATDEALVKRLIGNHKISLILTDPPYAINYVGAKNGLVKINKQKHIENDGYQTDEEYREFTKNWLENCVPCLTQKNAVYIFNSDKMLFALRNGMQEVGIKFAQLLIWIKNNSVMGRLNYLPQHELIAYGWYGTHQFMKSQDKSVLFYPKPHKSPLHPTQKPIGLLRRLILNSSKLNDIVYDPFLGSGSTLLACEQTKRRCFGVELDPEYCQVIMKRWEKLTGQKAEKLE